MSAALRLTYNTGVYIVWQGAEVRLVLPVAELPEWQALFRAAPATAESGGHAAILDLAVTRGALRHGAHCGPGVQYG